MNSREKGKRGERTVCKLLTEATGVEWRRTAQVRGKNDGAPDIECLDPRYAGLWVEVKDRAGWSVGCSEWADALDRTMAEASQRNKVGVLVWRAARGRFVATFFFHGLIVTYDSVGDAIGYAAGAKTCWCLTAN